MSSILERSCSSAIEDSEVDEGDWRGLSKGEAETEGTDESVGWLRFSAARLGMAVDDMVGKIICIAERSFFLQL